MLINEESNINENEKDYSRIYSYKKYADYKMKVGGWLMLFSLQLGIILPIASLVYFYRLFIQSNFILELESYLYVDFLLLLGYLFTDFS